MPINTKSPLEIAEKITEATGNLRTQLENLYKHLEHKPDAQNNVQHKIELIHQFEEKVDKAVQDFNNTMLKSPLTAIK